MRKHAPPGTRLAVALLIETSNQYSRELLHGIRAYLGKHGPWAVHLTEQGRGDVPPPWLARWQGDGIIARIEKPEIERAVRATGCPVVNVSASGLAPEFPTVISASAGVAKLAADHLLQRGFRHFAYCGDSRFPWSARHGANFSDCLRQAGHAPALFDSEPSDFEDWRTEQRKLARWIESLPKPVGVMACYDIRGQQVLDVCRELRVRVPDEVAVIGQHNDELLCELCDPPLSSVIPNARRAGHEAAALLDQMMRGRRPKARIYEIAPVGVATRQSTDVIALSDRRIAAAVQFICENACRPIGVEDVLRAAPMSRTLLERRFRELLGCDPYEEILRQRLRHATELLSSTDLQIGEIAQRAGFSTPEYFSAAFKKQAGLCPIRYRMKHSQFR
jgi:LacI family transcriptional regulator